MKFQTAPGVLVPCLDEIHECYEVIERTDCESWKHFYSFAINISYPNLCPILEDFCSNLEEPGFFLCEIPVTRQEEEKLRQTNEDPFHKNVYYKDNCSRAELLDILHTYGEWLLQDGMCCFGFASHPAKDEIFVGKYKITNIFTSDGERYRNFLARYQIPQEDKIKTVWDTFTRDAPGECCGVTIDGKTVHDMVNELQEKGLYLAECRED